ncbi:MAG: hypothetical protein AABX59_02035 [Nanoarchaeota archaeon]
MDSDAHNQTPVRSGLTRIISKYIGYARTEAQTPEKLGEIISDVRDLYGVALQVQDTESIRYITGFMEGIVTTLTATGQRTDAVKDWGNLMTIPKLPPPNSHSSKETKKERGYDDSRSQHHSLTPSKERIPFDRIQAQSPKNGGESHNFLLKDARFRDLPLEELNEDELPFNHPFYIRGSDLHKVTGVTSYQTILRRVTKLGIETRESDSDGNTWYKIERKEIYEQLKLDGRVTRHLKSLETMISSDKSERKVSRTREKNGGIWIKDANFEDVQIQSLESGELSLSEGCYLRPVQIMELTGIRSNVNYKLNKLGAKVKKVSPKESWYFIDEEVHSKLLRDDRGRRNASQQGNAGQNGNSSQSGYTSVYELSEELGMNRMKFLETLTKLDIETVDFEVGGISVPHITKSDKKKILEKTSGDKAS